MLVLSEAMVAELRAYLDAIKPDGSYTDEQKQAIEGIENLLYPLCSVPDDYGNTLPREFPYECGNCVQFLYLNMEEGYRMYEAHLIGFGAAGPHHPKDAAWLRRMAFLAGVRKMLGLPVYEEES